MNDKINPLLWGPINMRRAAQVEKTPPKYQVGEIVDVNSWTGLKKGFEVKDVKITYHPRMDEYVWGYAVYKEGESTGLTFTYIPEGYLRKHSEEK